MNVLPRISRCAPSLAALALAACNAPGEGALQQGEASGAASEPTSSAAATATLSAAETFEQRLSRIEQAIADWRTAPDIAAAHRAAEEARNLVVGPAGPYYGDANDDGTVSGASGQGLLPGTGGEPAIAEAGLNACIDRDVRGGDWSDPGERWAILDRAIRTWTPANNPFPTLPSHPQRIVGWASLTLETQDIAQAREFAGHARIHSDVSREALENCG